MTLLAQSSHFAPGPVLILFTILVVGAIAVSLLTGNSRKAGKVMVILAMVLGLGVFWLYFASHRQVEIARYEAQVRMEAAKLAAHRTHQLAPRPGGGPAPELPEDAPSPSSRDAGRTIAAPNDFAQWERDGIIGFQPAHDWSEEMSGSSFREATVGDTRFQYWQESNAGRLLGFSRPQGTREQAYREASQAASRKLAVLGLMELERRKKKTDAHAALPLALDLASSPQMYHEESKHYESTRQSYGEVYRAAVAIRAGGDEVDDLASAIGKEIDRGWVARQDEVRSWFLATGAALVAAFAIFLFYAFANAGTKGYFAWPLRLASLGLFALLCAGIYYVRLKMGLG